MTKGKNVLTTGQVAKICNVAPRTVSKWFDTGQLRGYRIPGSKDRRIPLGDLILFMKEHGMPLNGLDGGKTRVLVLDGEATVRQMLSETLGREAGFEVKCVATAFEAGVAIEHMRPDVLVVDITLPDVQPEQVCRDVRSNAKLSSLKVIATGGEISDGEQQVILQAGFNACVKKPFSIDQFKSALHLVLAKK